MSYNCYELGVPRDICSVIEISSSLAALSANADGGLLRVNLHRRLDPAIATSHALMGILDGVLALETIPSGGRRQILDFLMPGDVISTALVFQLPGFHLRAVAPATLEQLSSSIEPRLSEMLAKQFRSQLMRRNLNQIIIGQLDAEARVVSFLLMQKGRGTGGSAGHDALQLPMTRDDIADHLSINPDTLSRVMMRLEAAGCIRRLSRHVIVLTDDRRLAELTPISRLLRSAQSGEPFDVHEAR